MNDTFTKVLLVVIAVGIWANVFQQGDAVQKVRVVNSTIDINLQEINGQSEVFYEDNDGASMVIPVTIR
jgi:hypothetical protein